MFEFTVKSVVRDEFYYFCDLLPLSDNSDRVTEVIRNRDGRKYDKGLHLHSNGELGF